MTFRMQQFPFEILFVATDIKYEMISHFARHFLAATLLLFPFTCFSSSGSDLYKKDTKRKYASMFSTCWGYYTSTLVSNVYLLFIITEILTLTNSPLLPLFICLRDIQLSFFSTDTLVANFYDSHKLLNRFIFFLFLLFVHFVNLFHVDFNIYHDLWSFAAIYCYPGGIYT